MAHLQRAVEMSHLETEKIPVYHRQAYYRYYYYKSRLIDWSYDIKRNEGIVYLFFFFISPRALFQTSFVFERW